MNTLSHKGYGRIYVDNIDNIPKVEEIIKETDDYEYEYYFHKEILAVCTEYPKVVYTHKFCDMDMDKLTAKCWAKGIHIWVFDARHEEFPAA